MSTKRVSISPSISEPTSKKSKLVDIPPWKYEELEYLVDLRTAPETHMKFISETDTLLRRGLWADVCTQLHQKGYERSIYQARKRFDRMKSSFIRLQSKIRAVETAEQKDALKTTLPGYDALERMYQGKLLDESLKKESIEQPVRKESALAKIIREESDRVIKAMERMIDKMEANATERHREVLAFLGKP